MITVAHLKKTYADAITDEQCCVGGTLCLEVQKQYPGYPSTPTCVRFPSTLYLGFILHQVNPALDTSRSSKAAKAIILYNDWDEQDRAWEELDRALTYTGEPS